MRILFASAVIAYDFDFSAAAIADTAVFAAVIRSMLSVVMMLMLFTNSHNIINVVVVLVNNIILMNFIVSVLDYMTMLENTSVIRAAVLPSVFAPATVVSFTTHFIISSLSKFLFVSTAFAILHCYRICTNVKVGA